MAVARPAGTWTYADLALLPDNGTRYEIMDGELYELHSPKPAHAVAIMALIWLLLPVCDRLGATFLTAALNIFFAGADPVQPDLFAFFPGGRARFSDRGVEGPPDLMIEGLSPSNRTHDTVRKRALYARGGVREYWIVDPEAASIEIIGADGETVQRVNAADGAAALTLRSPLLSLCDA
ncbi:MAG: Uma2 family endonuclease [Thermomicrobiales bacterium]